jgi:hypothetical protein
VYYYIRGKKIGKKEEYVQGNLLANPFYTFFNADSK